MPVLGVPILSPHGQRTNTTYFSLRVNSTGGPNKIRAYPEGASHGVDAARPLTSEAGGEE